MNDDAFVNVLVSVFEEDGNTGFGDQLIRDARAKILSGKGEIGALTSSALNGKSFSRSVQLTAVQVLDCCMRAKDIYKNGDDSKVVSATRADFREMTY